MRPAALLLLALGLSAQGPPPAPRPPLPIEALDADGAVPSSDPDPASLPWASDTLRSREAPAAVARYRADPDFQYDTPRAKGLSLWDRLLRWLSRTLFESIAQNTTAQFWQIVLVAFAVGALGWVIARLASAEGSGIFGLRAPAPAPGLLLDVEDIAAVDLDARLRSALDRGDLREAVRVRYLRVLQALDAAGVLAWRRDKTNRQYVAEVIASRADLAAPFRSVTRAFDAVWYGERPVPPSLYAELAPLFDRAAP